MRRITSNSQLIALMLRMGIFVCPFLSSFATANMVSHIEAECTAAPFLSQFLNSDEVKNLKLIYSENLVTPNLRILGNSLEPFETRLEDWLAVYGLGLVRTNSGSLLISRPTPTPFYMAGKLVDARGQAIANAEIYITALNRRVFSSDNGCFVVKGKEKVASSEFRVSGFKSQMISTLSGGWHLIQLQELSSASIEDVIVTGSQHRLMHADVSSRQYLHRDNIERLPHLGDDITRVFRHLPGAASGDISPKINARGGAQNETVLVLDGLELHNPWYFKGVDGVVSIVDSNTIASVDVLAGGFTADHGGKTGAIANIVTVNPDSVRDTLGISFLTAYGQTAGTFNDGKDGWLMSLRGGYLDLALRLTGGNDNLQPRYYDVFSKVEVPVSDTTDLVFNVLSAHDSLHFDDLIMNNKYGFVEDTSSNNNVWINLRTRLSDGLQMNNTLFLTATRYQLEGFYHDPELIWHDERHYDAWGIKSAWVTKLHEDHLLKWGFELKEVAANYDYFLAVNVAPYHVNPLHLMTLNREAILQPDGQEQVAYLSYRFRWFDRLTSEFGGRWERQTYLEPSQEAHLGPRINLVYDLSDFTSLHVAWGRFWQAQAIDELFPGDGDMNFHPGQKVEQKVLSLHHSPVSGVSLRLDLYERKYSSVLVRYENLYEDIGRFINEGTIDRVRIAPDSALARGIEFGVSYEGGTYFSAWANYSYSHAEDHFSGRTAPRLWDQRHAGNVSFNWDNNRWAFNLTAMARSGWPATPLGELLGRSTGEVLDFDAARYNTKRLGGYSRVDIRLMRKMVFDKGSLLQVYVEIYNLFDTKNPCCVDYQIYDSRRGDENNISDNWLSRMPSLGIRYRF